MDPGSDCPWPDVVRKYYRQPWSINFMCLKHLETLELGLWYWLPSFRGIDVGSNPYLCHLCLYTAGFQGCYSLLCCWRTVKIHKAVAWNRETASRGGRRCKGGRRPRLFRRQRKNYDPYKGSCREKEKWRGLRWLSMCSSHPEVRFTLLLKMLRKWSS
jgi:hypothetical protein